MKNIMNIYSQMNSEFSSSLEDRTSNEIAHDTIVIEELKKNIPLEKALQIAEKKYPNEGLKYTPETIDDIKTYYVNLLQHTLVTSKMGHLLN